VAEEAGHFTAFGIHESARPNWHGFVGSKRRTRVSHEGNVWRGSNAFIVTGCPFHEWIQIRWLRTRVASVAAILLDSAPRTVGFGTDTYAHLAAFLRLASRLFLDEVIGTLGFTESLLIVAFSEAKFTNPFIQGQFASSPLVLLSEFSVFSTWA
jgi:hypothetical protein